MAQVGKAFNPVQRNQIWTELCNKEAGRLKMAEEFTVTHPRKMTLLPAKPNATCPAMQPTAAELDAAHDTLATLSCVKNYERPPKDVYALPVTGNMEYGFFTQVRPLRDPMFQHYLNSSEVTSYTSAYIAFSGKSPFCKKNVAGGPAKK